MVAQRSDWRCVDKSMKAIQRLGDDTDDAVAGNTGHASSGDAGRQ